MLYLQGEFLRLEDGRVSVLDRGFQFGDGVYELVKVLNGRLLWMDEHLSRLRGSLGELRMDGALTMTPGARRLEEVLPELVARSGLESGTVYVQVTRGAASRGFELPPTFSPTVLAYTQLTEFLTPDEIRAGVAVHPVEDYRWGRCNVKSTNLLAAIMGKEEARAAGAHEVLWIGPGSVVREGGSCNIFALLGGVLRTHPLGCHVLAGVTRGKVIELARGLGLEVHETAFDLQEITAASEVFLTATTRDVVPVVAVGGQAVGRGSAGPLTLKLADALRAEISGAVGLAAPASLSAG
jgi:D-alanine transaminase